MESDESKRSRSQTALAVTSVAQTSIYRPFGTGAVDERICRHDPAHYGRAKTSALLVGAPFCYASACARFEPFLTRLQILYRRAGRFGNTPTWVFASKKGWGGLSMWPPCFCLWG